MSIFGKGNTVNMIHYDGLPGYGKGYAITVTLDEVNRCLTFHSRAFKNAPDVNLPLEKVINIGSIDVKDIDKPQKNPLYDSYATDAVKFALRGMTDKDMKLFRYSVVINYVSDSDGNKNWHKAIVIASNGSNPNLGSFLKNTQSYLKKTVTL